MPYLCLFNYWPAAVVDCAFPFMSGKTEGLSVQAAAKMELSFELYGTMHQL